MSFITDIKQKYQEIKDDRQFANDRNKAITMSKNFLMTLFRIVIIVGISYIIIGPLIGIISSAFFSNADKYNPMVYVVPQNPTLERFKLAILRLDYWKGLRNILIYDGTIMILQVLICSMVGYGFARFDFPFKKVLFGLVVVMIILPSNTIMLPLYVTFRQFDIFGIITAIRGAPINLMNSPFPMILMTLFGCGLRAGLFIYIFNQFFRGLPKEIEEAAFVDGAGMWYTYFRIMLVNAIPSVITVAVFSLVWQYNDLFYAKLFLIPDNIVISKKISSLAATISAVDQIKDPSIVQLYNYAGILLIMLPVIVIYVVLQKFFIEGVERSGIVG